MKKIKIEHIYWALLVWTHSSGTKYYQLWHRENHKKKACIKIGKGVHDGGYPFRRSNYPFCRNCHHDIPEKIRFLVELLIIQHENFEGDNNERI